MDEFPPNSRKKAEEDETPRDIKQVTSAEVRQPKNGLGRRVKETFIGGDMKSAGHHVLLSVVVPEIKNMLYEAFDTGMRSWIFGQDRRPPGSVGGMPGGGYSSIGRRDYSSFSGNTTAASRQAPQQAMISRQSRARHDFAELIIPNHRDAEEVLEQMYEILSRHGMVSIADLYEMTGVRSEHTDMKWGWTSLRGAKAVRRRNGGFFLDLPEPEPFGR